MPTNEFLPFASAVGANVISQAAFTALSGRASGFVAGEAQSSQANKVWRQASFMAAAIGQFVANNGGVDVVDDGDVTGLERRIFRALRPQSMNYYVGTGVANTYVVTSGTGTALVAVIAGTPIRVKIPATNTGASTFAIDGLPPIAASRPNGQALQGGDLLLGGIADLVYDGVKLQLVSFNGSTLPRTQKTVFTASGTFTATVAGPHRFSVWGAGGGGGSGGGGIAGSGGSAGCYGEVTKILAAGDTVAVVIGAGGTAGTNGGTNGGAGGNSTVTIAGTTFTSAGGPGGLSNTTAGTSTNSPGTGSSAGAWDRVLVGQQGGPGYLMTNPGAAGGQGGSAPLGGLGGGGGGANNPAATATGARGEAWVEW
jgi:hypothetical protein